MNHPQFLSKRSLNIFTYYIQFAIYIYMIFKAKSMSFQSNEFVTYFHVKFYLMFY